MKGRRSSDQNFVFGYPCEFLGNVFPRENEIVSHAQFLRRHNSSVGVWKQNTPDKVVAKQVAIDIFAIWNKTEIPCCGSNGVEERVERLLVRDGDNGGEKMRVNCDNYQYVVGSWQATHTSLPVGKTVVQLGHC